MASNDELLLLAINIAQDALKHLEQVIGKPNSLEYRFSEPLPKEIKANIDLELEALILSRLKPVGLPMLSEEAGDIKGSIENGLHWIIDPLDGTANFVRKIGGSAVSIALWSGNSPVFGVIGEFPSCSLAWGGKSFGSFLDGNRLHVSDFRKRGQSILCSGFPSRFDFMNPRANQFWEMLSSFGKVRMLGAASISLLQVASGKADAYIEEDIMIWDVASGLAILEGAGGKYKITPGQHLYSYYVEATNGLLE